jgi:uncharacterized lipoprotein YmbA
MMMGCASTPPSSFYILNALSGLEQNERVALAPSEDLFIGVGPVKIPDYLDRVQIVTRAGDTTLEISEYHRWSEPLDKSLERIIAENLTRLLATDNVLVYPWPGTRRVDYQVVIEVKRFEGKPGDKVRLDACWTILTEEGKQVRLCRNSYISEPVGGNSHEDMVSSLSRAAGRLSREIATAIAEEARNSQGISPHD